MLFTEASPAKGETKKGDQIMIPSEYTSFNAVKSHDSEPKNLLLFPKR